VTIIIIIISSIVVQTMLVRATARGVRFFTEWLHEIVQTNVMNDQKVMHFQALRAVYTPDCFVSFAPHALPRIFDGTDLPLTGRYNATARYCFLSELLFQNGETAFRCAVKGNYRDSWILEMFRHAVRRPDYSPMEVLALREEGSVPASPDLYAQRSDKRSSRQSKRLGSSERFPVIVHANYCDKKSHELQLRGLWLLNQSADGSRHYCLAYDVHHTIYAKMDWEREVAAVHQQRRHLFNTYIRNGSLVRGLKSREIYEVTIDKQRRLVPDSATFVWLFGEHRWTDVRSLPEGVLSMVPIAAPYPSVVERLVPQWKAIPGDDISLTANTTFVYKRIHLDNGTLVRSSSEAVKGGSKTTTSTSAPKQSSRPIYMLSIGRIYNDTEGAYSEVWHKSKRAIDDRASFVEHFGEGRWKDVLPLPEYLLDEIEDGIPLSSHHHITIPIAT